MRRAHAVAFLLAVLPLELRPQSTPPASEAIRDTLSVSGALLHSDDATSVGARWLAAISAQSGWRGDLLPRRGHIEAQGKGTWALHARSHNEPITATVDAGVFVSLYKAGEFSPNPDEEGKGGFNLGAARVLLRAEGEGQQGVNTINGKGGGVFRYTNSDRMWPIFPSFDIAYELVRPMATDTGDAAALDQHRRFDAAAYWAIPLFATPVKLFGDLAYWDLIDADTTELRSGIHGGASLAWVRPATLWKIELASVFLRWSGGAVPLDQTDRKTWSVGIVAYRAQRE